MAITIYEGHSIEPVELFLERLRLNDEGMTAVRERFGNMHGKFGEMKICLEDDGSVIAVCDAGFPEDEGLPEVGIIIDPEYRGRGYGKKLLKKMKWELKARGVKEVVIFLDTNNPSAQHLAGKYRAFPDLYGAFGRPDCRDVLPYVLQI